MKSIVCQFSTQDWHCTISCLCTSPLSILCHPPPLLPIPLHLSLSSSHPLHSSLSHLILFISSLNAYQFRGCSGAHALMTCVYFLQDEHQRYQRCHCLRVCFPLICLMERQLPVRRSPRFQGEYPVPHLSRGTPRHRNLGTSSLTPSRASPSPPSPY